MASSIDEISGIGPKTLEKLQESGIDSIDKLASADIEDITSAGMSTSRAKDVKYKAKQNTVEIQTGIEVEEEYENKNKFSTGIEKLDKALEGGLQEEAVISLWGESGTGKTQIAQKLLVEGYEQTGDDAIYIETEKDRFRPERIKSLSSKDDTIDNIHRVKAYSIDQQYSSYDKVCNVFDEASIVVVDSLTARIRLSSQFDGRGKLSELSETLGKHLIKLEEMSERLQCPVVFTNQAYRNPDSYGKKVLQYGGSKIKHTSQFHVKMSEAQGELHAVEVQNHPSTGNTEIIVDIQEDDIVGKN